MGKWNCWYCVFVFFDFRKFFKMDVTNRKEIESVVENIKKLNTGLYGVVNSAGVAVPPGFKR